MSTYKFSVHELIDRVLLEGSIDNRFQFSEHTAQAGTRLHQKLQKKFAKIENYTAELSISDNFAIDDFTIEIEGRIDGIISGQSTILDEIKTSEYQFSKLPASQLNHYWHQLMIYGYLYAKQNSLETLDLRLSYFQTTEEELTQEIRTLTFSALETFFNSVLAELVEWLKYVQAHREKRNRSIEALEFPFANYRQGQRQLMKAVYATILEEKRLYTMAPTGIGKTLSTIFPTLKAMSTTGIQRLFYLTAKIATRKVAEETVELLAESGFFATSVTLSSKDSICFLEERSCNPDECPFAKDYYHKLRANRRAILDSETRFTRPVIEQLAKNYQLCPFELGLDLSNFADVIILDYNYLFDPRAYLRRFFSSADNENFLLIDEAHNLVDRTREMYSASLSLKQIQYILKLASDKKLKRQLRKLVNELENLAGFLRDNHRVFHAQSQDSTTVQQLILKIGELFKKEIASALPDKQQTLLNFYFELMAYARINDYYDSSFKTYLKLMDDDFQITITCLNPSTIIDEKLGLTRGAVLFSASFTPLSYYQKSLGGQTSDYYLSVPSPFKTSQHLLLINPTISVTYRHRQQNIAKIVQQINTLINAQHGNYLVFFPSFAFLNLFLAEFETTAKVLVQTQAMTVEDKQAFLAHFNQENQEKTVGLAVLGGSFAEGIDLKGKRLIGLAIVTVGLPMITDETNEIQQYYQAQQLNGFQYAYQIPAMNKVIQAVGRLIRTENDYGVTLLIDERFGTKQYQQFFPPHWQDFQTVKNNRELTNQLAKFWGNQNIR